MSGDTVQPSAPNQPESNWQYKPERPGSVANTPPLETAEPEATTSQFQPPSDDTISWTASEFVAHHKSPGWYLAYAVIAVVVVAVAYLFTRDVISTVIIAIAVIFFGVAANRKPRTMSYELGPHGLIIGNNLFPYTELKSFSIAHEGAVSNITFIPLKRFMPPITVYYEPKDEDKITEILSLYLPYEHRPPDVANRLANRIRF